MNVDLKGYLKQIKSLKRGFNKGLGKAPHKPILLLSIIRMIEQNKLLSNRIEITSDLILIFKEYFKTLVFTGHVDNFSLPFFHMKSEPFYRLIPNGGMSHRLGKEKSIKSINKLSELIAFAEIDKTLFQLLQRPEERSLIYNVIFEEYFTQFSNDTYIYTDVSETKIQDEILKESKVTYLSKLERLRSSIDNDSYEEEVFLRGGVFKKTVPRIYEYTCCVTGFKISTHYNIQMVDACHIIPFSVCQDDTIQNGISLSPNIHRTFDRGLITINNDYLVRVSPTIDASSTTKSIIELDGKPIKLPSNKNHYPSLEAIEWHRKEVFLF